MSDFTTTVLEPKTLDPTKRVRYTMGLVLGVDEFQQEQTYFAERDRLHQRALHGYGTVKGLRVEVRPGTRGPVVAVAPGLAVDPYGRTICVPAEQCAQLDAWLTRNRADVLAAAGSPPGPVAVYVVLCYRECEADLVPVPGGPCRTQEDARTASRIADAFDLRLTLDPPAHPEEQALRTFGERLRHTRPDSTAPLRSAAALLALARTLFAPEPASPPEPGSPPDSPPVFSSPPGSPPDLSSPPGAEPALLVHPDDLSAFLRSVVYVWSTEVLPLLSGACAAPAGDPCVLLARLDVDVEEAAGALRVADTDGDAVADVSVAEEERPFLLSTRFLQEWLPAGGFGLGGGLLAALSGGPPAVMPLLLGTAPPALPLLLGGVAPGPTRILAVSWRHGQPSEGVVNVTMGGGGTTSALVVAFGATTPGDRTVRVEDGSLDEDTFQAFVQKGDTRGFWVPRGVQPRRILPVNVLVVDGVVTAASEAAGPSAPGAAFVIDAQTLDRLGSQKLSVVVKSGSVRDDGGALLRDPGFESWFFRIAERIDLNAATAADLQRLPKIGPSLAARIITFRTSIGSFVSVDDLMDVDGIGESLLTFLRPYVFVA